MNHCVFRWRIFTPQKQKANGGWLALRGMVTPWSRNRRNFPNRRAPFKIQIINPLSRLTSPNSPVHRGWIPRYDEEFSLSSWAVMYFDSFLSGVRLTASHPSRTTLMRARDFLNWTLQKFSNAKSYALCCIAAEMWGLLYHFYTWSSNPSFSH